MQSVTLPSGKTIRYFADIDEFPAERRAWLTRYQLEAAEFPLDSRSVADKYGQIMLAYREGRAEEGETLLQNLYLATQAMADNYAPDELSLGVLIHDIDGVEVTDLSPEGLRPLMQSLQIPVYLVRQITDDVKKNSAPRETAISLGL